MKASTLPSPGSYSNSQRLRHESSTAISYVEIAASKTASGKSTSATQLRTFFTACATALDSIYDSTAPTVSSARVQNATPNKVEITFTEALDTSVVPTPGQLAFVLSPVKTITAIEIAGTKVTITVSEPFVNGNVIDVDYTVPATNAVRDPAGNQVASFVSAAVTNNVV